MKPNISCILVLSFIRMHETDEINLIF